MVSIGSNSFHHVPFPVAIGNRYVHVLGHLDRNPEVRVFVWNEETGVAEEEPASDGSPLTWNATGDGGGIRIQADPPKLKGYISGGPKDSIVVILGDDSIRVMSGDQLLGHFAGNMISGFDVGIHVDPFTQGFSLGSQLPEGFNYIIAHSNEVVRLTDLLAAQDIRLANREFTDCELWGPAVISPMDGVSFQHCVFDPLGATVEALVWESPPNLPPVGAIPIENVQFESCRFMGIALAVPHGERENALSQLPPIS